MKAKDGVSIETQKATEIIMNWIYPYYNQDVTKNIDKQFNWASNKLETTYLDYTETPMQTYFEAQQVKMHIFDNLWFDFSGITFFDFGYH